MTFQLGNARRFNTLLHTACRKMEEMALEGEELEGDACLSQIGIERSIKYPI